MNIEELLKKPFNKLTKEEIEWAFANIEWAKLFEAYTKKEEEELKRLSENN
jgi:hypothetical protein